PRTDEGKAEENRSDGASGNESPERNRPEAANQAARYAVPHTQRPARQYAQIRGFAQNYRQAARARCKNQRTPRAARHDRAAPRSEATLEASAGRGKNWPTHRRREDLPTGATGKNGSRAVRTEAIENAHL